MRKKSNPIKYELDDVSGKCALEALAAMFNLSATGIKVVMRASGWKQNDDGTTTKQIRAALNLLTAIYKKKIKYTHNRKRLSISRFAQQHKRGWYLLNQDGHICCYKHGVFVDNYTPENYTLLGWWEIAKEFTKPMCKPCENRVKLQPFTFFMTPIRLESSCSESMPAYIHQTLCH